jgi:hypothetical protein
MYRYPTTWYEKQQIIITVTTTVTQDTGSYLEKYLGE